MSVQLSKQQLDPLNEGSSNAIVVEDSDTNLKYVVLSESAYRRAQPLLDLISSGDSAAISNSKPWTEADNERRIDLINKKYDSKLTKAEDEELQQLQDRAYQHRKEVAPVRNEVLTLALEALEKRANAAK